MSLAMELRLESLASSAQSLRNIAFRSASPFNSRIRYVSQPHGFRDQSHGLFYQSPVCKHSKKSARTAMAEIASDIASVPLEQDLLQQLENLKLQMKEKKRELKEHRKALKAAAKAKKSQKKMGASKSSSSSSSESSNSDEEDCNTFDMRAVRQKQAARIMKEKHLPQGTLSIATIESRQCSSSQVSLTELKSEPVELNSCSCIQNMQIVPNQCVSSPEVPMESKSCSSREETLAAEETVSIATKESRQCSSSKGLPTELNSYSPSQERTIVSEPVELNSCSCSKNMPIISKSIGSKPCLRREETLAGERIEVCVGGSCRRAGSKTLLGSLQERIPANSGACAVACKCMGRCDKSINVRIVKDEARPQFHSHAQVDDADWLLRHHFGAEILPIHLPSLDPCEGELTPMVSLAK